MLEFFPSFLELSYMQSIEVLIVVIEQILIHISLENMKKKTIIKLTKIKR